ncbi:MAG TPA: hypothetical protein VEK56_15920 [Vicinamibacterales bacterium]|nr:hypothetical protein [Vicinamibacterales bacterium]
MRLIRFAILLVGTISLAACINASTLIKVKLDGSGTIEQTMMMNTAAVKSLMSGIDPQGQMQMKQSNPFDAASLERAVDRMGKGVRFVSATPISQNGFEGVKGIYAFDDINQVSVSQDVPNPSAAPGSGKPSPVTFKLARQGGSSVLTVTFDEKAMSGTKTPPVTVKPETVDPAMMQMMTAIFQGFKVAIDLEVDGKIVKTNADYVTGSRITLLEIEMTSLLQDQAKLAQLQSKMSPTASIADIKPLLKDVKGIKINEPVVTVEFR